MQSTKKHQGILRQGMDAAMLGSLYVAVDAKCVRYAGLLDCGI
jgi:hypothetical protein